MDLSHTIIGQVVTEKAERLKGEKTYTLRVHPDATKVDIKNALRRFYDIDATAVRMMRTRPKTRKMPGRGGEMEKRHRTKKALVTLAPKSKALDLTTLKAR